MPGFCDTIKQKTGKEGSYEKDGLIVSDICSVVGGSHACFRRLRQHIAAQCIEINCTQHLRDLAEYVNGEYDVMATTDVIGHGINLPIDNVVFAQTDKFDGVSHRNLYLWEAAQIAGRAGRYGMTDIGHAYAIEYGLPHSGAHCSADLVQQATLAACGTIPTDLAIDKALVTPRFGDLGVSDTRDMMLALDEWSRIASERLSGMGITAAPMTRERRI